LTKQAAEEFQCEIILTAAVITISAAISDAACAQGMDLGKNEYLRSCASCHGETGKGDGPAAKSLPKPPGDLTKLAKNNNGVFPISRVYDVIDGRMQVIMHGTREMPVWGDVFRRELMARERREKHVAGSAGCHGARQDFDADRVCFEIAGQMMAAGPGPISSSRLMLIPGREAAEPPLRASFLKYRRSCSCGRQL
jgi:mono/diheme cytochrome c family protein